MPDFAIRPFALVLALTLACAATGAPAAAQEARPAPLRTAAPAAPSTPTEHGARPAPLAGDAALTDREQLLISLFPAVCEGRTAFEVSSDDECPDRLTSGKGVSCDTVGKALDGLVDALARNCKAACARIPCGELRRDRCGSFGHEYKRNPEDCNEVTAEDCPGDKLGFVCRAPSVVCICICANA